MAQNLAGQNSIVSEGFEVSAQAVTTIGSYVDATTITNLGLQKQDMDETLIKRYGTQGLQGFLQAIGNIKATGSDEFMHFEERMLHEEFVLPAEATNVAGDISADDTTARVINIADKYADQLRKNSVIKFADGNLGGEVCIVTAVDTTSSPNTVTILPYANTFTSKTEAHYNGAKFVVIGLEFGKGSKQPTGLEPLVDKKYGRTAIFKESFAVSGSDATQVVYVKVNSPATGKSGYVWYLKGEGDTRQRFNDYMEAQMMFMEKTGSTAVADPSGTYGNLTGYQGLISKILEEGIEDLAGTNTTITDEAVDAWVDAFDKQRGAKEYTAWCGLNYNIAIDDWLASKNMHSGSTENWGAFNNSKDMALHLGFSSFTRAGYTFHKKNYDLFNDRGMGGSLGYRTKALFVPAGMSKDAKSGDSLPALSMRYREANGYSRKMEHWLTGSAVLQRPTDTEDALRCHYRTERGLQVYGANRFMISDINGA